MLAGALTDDGQWLDHEYVADILDLACIESSEQPGGDRRGKLRRRTLMHDGRPAGEGSPGPQLPLLRPARRVALPQPAGPQGRARGQDPRVPAKEKEARKLARRPTTRWSSCGSRRKPASGSSVPRRADEDFRDTRKKLRAEADKYLELIEQSLKGTQRPSTCSHPLEGRHMRPRCTPATTPTINPTGITRGTKQ
jgi:hypothetical protein